jgi:hypothetical protein
MKDVSMLQLLVGAASALALVVSASFVGYLNLFNRKQRSTVRQESMKVPNPGVPLSRTSYQQQ